MVEERTGEQLDVAEWLDDPTPERISHLLAPSARQASQGQVIVRENGPVSLREGTPVARICTWCTARAWAGFPTAP